MFFRQKKSGKRVYLQIVENRWEQGRSKQRVIATLGRLDRLSESGQLDALLQSGAKFSESVMVLAAHREGETPVVSTRRIGPAIVFARLWEELQIPQVIRRLLAGRRLTLPVERILFLTVLHRLFASGSDRSCLRVWKQDQQIPGSETIALHQVYRAMAWLGEPLPKDQQAGATPFSPRCTKDAPSRKPCSTAAVTCSANWNWCSSIRRRSTSRAKEAPTWDNTGTAKITARTASRWWSARCSTARGGRCAVNCGPAT